MKKQQILITGGDGYLGLALAKRYLQSTDEPLLLWVRASDETEFAAKQERIRQRLGAETDRRVRCRWGNLVNPDPFESIDPVEIRVIIHAAAVTRFNLDETTARRVNVEGTEKLLRFASRCPSLDRFALLSTVYSSGLKAGAIEEVPMDNRAGFSNHYEWSKWASENLLLTAFSDLPWQIFRVATIIADNEEGEVTQQNAFHNTLKLFYYGLLSLIPGKTETPLYFITGDFATNAIFSLLSASLKKSIYHVAHTKEESISLQAMIDLVFETYEEKPEFKMRRVLKPLYSDAESFDLLAQGVNTFGAGILNQSLSSVAPFARQLFIQKEVQNRNLASALDHYRAPDARRLVRNACDYLVRTKWGRELQHAAR
ncbi:MAG: SDR family oxidoreductase [Candidatus Manganitrophaceae bacterium]